MLCQCGCPRLYVTMLGQAACSKCRRCADGRHKPTAAPDRVVSATPGVDASTGHSAGNTRDDALATMLLQRVNKQCAAREPPPTEQQLMPASSQHASPSVGNPGGSVVSLTSQGSPAAARGWRSLRQVVVPAAAFTSAAHTFPAFPAWRPHMAFEGTTPHSPRQTPVVCMLRGCLLTTHLLAAYCTGAPNAELLQRSKGNRGRCSKRQHKATCKRLGS